MDFTLFSVYHPTIPSSLIFSSMLRYIQKLLLFVHRCLGGELIISLFKTFFDLVNGRVTHGQASNPLFTSLVVCTGTACREMYAPLQFLLQSNHKWYLKTLLHSLHISKPHNCQHSLHPGTFGPAASFSWNTSPHSNLLLQVLSYFSLHFKLVG